MSTLHQLREGLNEAWDNLMDGWQRLYRRASSAITKFTPGNRDGKEGADEAEQQIALRSAGWGVLPMEIYDDDDKIVVRLEAPGMEKDDFDLQVLDDYLVVRGEKQFGREHTKGRYHVTECAYGRFKRVIPLPGEIATARAHASYQHGVLRVELPKTATGQRKKVTVEVK